MGKRWEGRRWVYFCDSVTSGGLCLNKAKHRVWHEKHVVDACTSAVFVCGTHRNALARKWCDELYFEEIEDE